MNRHIKMFLSVILAFAFLFPAASVVYAEERACRGSLGAITVDNLRVPRNATRITVIGKIQAAGAKAVNVSASSVGGSIQIVHGGACRIHRVKVKGDILFDSNNRFLSSTYNRVGGNVQVFQNTGGVTVSYNTINGNLQCKQNRPAPTGRNNIVYGSKEGQCIRL